MIKFNKTEYNKNETILEQDRVVSKTSYHSPVHILFLKKELINKFLLFYFFAIEGIKLLTISWFHHK